ncbi:Poly(R)-hydroxyalkanoic acid synthase subunit (PHA_synth_III_E) [Halogranum gelatinilyticum]|uniref:Poly(R)-hydroxyalkanoic acid synthase subunit (PHA_synth_III_E) n=1 Tax=Halogranum gelatinilyticum TaxID=660521 RepID=A0A1G9URR0_9EURY|nr:poly(R)-hydroxyalkanoic acid synthase subunit PhaE [Halogranum gelatinilyticum]SDM62497.1 Poly(R)-hydroxyalkanoic acid synthase subunit (PHA_synth_III_E) [Halogranum gelatinilyticum]
MSNYPSEMYAPEKWSAFMENMNETFLDQLEQNVEAQAKFVESWMDAVDESADEERLTEGLEGYARAYEVWMNAAETQFERASDVIEGEDVSPEEFRDIWLNAANESFKEVMSTSAFAAATGQTVEDVLELQQEVDKQAEDTLHQLGFATEGDVVEVGERLVELERRQHAVEQKLDRVLAAIEE